MHLDTQSNPTIARSQVQRALDDNPFAILGFDSGISEGDDAAGRAGRNSRNWLRLQAEI